MDTDNQHPKIYIILQKASHLYKPWHVIIINQKNLFCSSDIFVFLKSFLIREVFLIAAALRYKRGNKKRPLKLTKAKIFLYKLHDYSSLPRLAISSDD